MRIQRFGLFAGTLGLTVAAAQAQSFDVADYFPIEAGYSWQAYDPTCTTPCSCPVNFNVDVLAPSAQGPNAFLVGDDPMSAPVFENTGSTFVVHGFFDSGVYIPILGGPIVMGSVTDGTSYPLTPEISVMVRRWSTVTSPDKALYGVDPVLDLICFVFYDSTFDGSANPHGAVFGSGLPGGVTPPSGSIDEVWWMSLARGLHATMEVEPDPMAGMPFDPWPPVLDAIYVPTLDCNGNGQFDRVDIQTGTSLDTNMNCVPDDCQFWFESCPAVPNSSGLSATLGFSGFSSNVGSGFHLECVDGPALQFGFFIVSATANSNVPLFDGVLCLDLPFGRYNPQIATNQGLPVLNSLGQFDGGGVLNSLAGNATSSGGSGFDVPLELPFAPPGQVILPGTSWCFQCWYRDGASANFSNVAEVSFD